MSKKKKILIGIIAIVLILAVVITTVVVVNAKKKPEPYTVEAAQQVVISYLDAISEKDFDIAIENIDYKGVYVWEELCNGDPETFVSMYQGMNEQDAEEYNNKVQTYMSNFLENGSYTLNYVENKSTEEISDGFYKVVDYVTVTTINDETGQEETTTEPDTCRYYVYNDKIVNDCSILEYINDYSYLY